MSKSKRYEAVVGIEIHAELDTRSKIFCSCPTDWGKDANTQTCPVCMGLPGALPTLNRRAVELACIAGRVLGCTINERSVTSRKNYFYPDLPKGYQISQSDIPLCEGGYIDFELDGEKKRVGITRIHIEEDAGKLTHDGERTYIDYNRSGIPLIEIVTEPDIRGAEEAVAFLEELRARLLFAGVSRCRMNEGNLRFDVNLSVREAGDTALYTRVEIKNLNSFANVARAIELEFARQVDIVEAGGKIVQGTLRYDEDADRVIFMREKENAVGYRFFDEPDILPIYIRADEIDKICEGIPKMPKERICDYREKYSLTEADALILCAHPRIADYFECAAKASISPKYTANLIIGELLRLTDTDRIFEDFSPERMAELSNMAEGREINSSNAKKLVGLLLGKAVSVREYVEEQGMLLIRDESTLSKYVIEAIKENAKSVEDYRRGKQNAIKAIFGAVMKKSGGNADPETVERLLCAELERIK